MDIVGHKKQWDFLKNKIDSGQVSHAYLFVGPDSVGKKKFAVELLKKINCDKKTGSDGCYNCRLISQEKHPDFFMVRAKEKPEIQISQIREVQQFLGLKPYCAAYKMVVVEDAEKMNSEAQSCFLKTLEEPKGSSTILILLSSKPEMILQTIFSRCSVVKFFPIGKKEIVKHLIDLGASEKKAGEIANLADGKPGRAIKLLQNPEIREKEEKMMADIAKIYGADIAEKFKYVKDLAEEDYTGFLAMFLRYCRIILREEDNVEKFGKIKEIAKKADQTALQIASSNINAKMALENLLLSI